jgi:hypothetical protein
MVVLLSPEIQEDMWLKSRERQINPKEFLARVEIINLAHIVEVIGFITQTKGKWKQSIRYKRLK